MSDEYLEELKRDVAQPMLRICDWREVKEHDVLFNPGQREWVEVLFVTPGDGPFVVEPLERPGTSFYLGGPFFLVASPAMQAICRVEAMCKRILRRMGETV